MKVMILVIVLLLLVAGGITWYLVSSDTNALRQPDQNSLDTLRERVSTTVSGEEMPPALPEG